MPCTYLSSFIWCPHCGLCVKWPQGAQVFTSMTECIPPCPQNCDPEFTPFLPLSCFFSGNYVTASEKQWINQASLSRDALPGHIQHCTSYRVWWGLGGECQSLTTCALPFDMVCAHYLLWIWASLQSRHSGTLLEIFRLSSVGSYPSGFNHCV